MIARCVVNEYSTSNDEQVGRGYQKEALQKGFFAAAKLSLIIKTSPTSNLVVSLYQTEEQANANLPDRQKFFDSLPVKLIDTFMYEGACEVVKNDLETFSPSVMKTDTTPSEKKLDRLLELLEAIDKKIN